MKTILCLVFVSVLALPAAWGRDFRELTNLEGRKLHAELLDLTDGKLKIRANDRVFEIPLETLSEEDRTFLAEWDAKRRGDGGDGADSEYPELIFADDFSADGFGEQWRHYKSGSVVKDGVLMGITPEGSDHAAVDSIRFEGRRDLEVSVKFKFAGPAGERFNIWFDDYNYKGSHAGHICSVSVSPTGGSIADAKTGAFENSIYEKKKSPEGLDADTLKMLESKTSRYSLELDRDEWHTLLVRTRGDRVVVSIDGKEVGELESEGVGHLTKSLVSLTTNLVDVHYDDFSVRAARVTAE